MDEQAPLPDAQGTHSPGDPLLLWCIKGRRKGRPFLRVSLPLCGSHQEGRIPGWWHVVDRSPFDARQRPGAPAGGASNEYRGLDPLLPDDHQEELHAPCRLTPRIASTAIPRRPGLGRRCSPAKHMSQPVGHATHTG